MSLENIEAGDPVAVYKSGSNWGSFIGITINNLRIGIIAFVLGIFGGIGTLWIMFKNCIMLGSFQYFFYENTIFQHYAVLAIGWYYFNHTGYYQLLLLNISF